MPKSNTLTESEELEIISFYLQPNSGLCTQNTFGISQAKFEGILKRHGIDKHSPETIQKISRQAARKTCLEKYGTEFPGGLPEFVEKAQNTNLERYGAKAPLQNKECLKKAQNTNLDKYGDTSAIRGKATKKKAEDKQVEKPPAKTGRHRRVEITESLEKEILEFYLVPNSAREVEKQFGVTQYILYKLLEKNNISKHDPETIEKIRKEKCEQTLLENYGVTCTFKSEEIREKSKETNQERYGCEYAMQNKEVQKKSRENFLKSREGEDYVEYFQSEEFKQRQQSGEFREKSKKTCIEKYGVENPLQNEEIKRKMMQTNRERYGVEIQTQREEIKQKIVQTNLENYGVEHTLQRADVRQKIVETNLEKYGFENPMQNEEVRKKYEQTCIERYGAECPFQNEEVQKKCVHTCQENYGVDFPTQSDEVKNKIAEVKKKNGTFNTSSGETLLYEFLCEKYGEDDVEKQYSCDRYPFHCDFYVKSEDLFVELNLNWTHGQHPFDETNEEDNRLLEEWMEKSETSDFYRNAVNTWSVRDVKKLQTAKENNLNY